jgi:Uma2 family endonuclease
MIELNKEIWSVDLPYTLRLHGVSEELFDELTNEDTRAELIDGVMIVHSPASLRHDDLNGFLHPILRAYTEERNLGHVLGPDSLVHLATCRKFAPDLYFLLPGRMPNARVVKQFEGVPDLVMEILSPSNRVEDLEDKRPAYQEAGVSEIWLIDPDAETIMIDRRARKRYRTTEASRGRVESSVIPGFWIKAEWLWADPLPKVLPTLRQILGE